MYKPFSLMPPSILRRLVLVVQQFERSQKYVKQRSLNKIVNIGHSDLI